MMKNPEKGNFKKKYMFMVSWLGLSNDPLEKSHN